MCSRSRVAPDIGASFCFNLEDSGDLIIPPFPLKCGNLNFLFLLPLDFQVYQSRTHLLEISHIGLRVHLVIVSLFGFLLLVFNPWSLPLHLALFDKRLLALPLVLYGHPRAPVVLPLPNCFHFSTSTADGFAGCPFNSFWPQFFLFRCLSHRHDGSFGWACSSLYRFITIFGGSTLLFNLSAVCHICFATAFSFCTVDVCFCSTGFFRCDRFYRQLCKHKPFGIIFPASALWPTGSTCSSFGSGLNRRVLLTGSFQFRDYASFREWLASFRTQLSRLGWAPMVGEALKRILPVGELPPLSIAVPDDRHQYLDLVGSDVVVSINCNFKALHFMSMFKYAAVFFEQLYSQCIVLGMPVSDHKNDIGWGCRAL